MTEELVIEMVKEWNGRIDSFIDNDLPVLLGYEKGTKEVPITEWFRANQIIKEHHFYELGHSIQKLLRANGFDVKMDMSNKLVYGNIR